ncbi:MAG: hypothetical protein AAF649_06195 [Verrucomicrobiota bacterium]
MQNKILSIIPLYIVLLVTPLGADVGQRSAGSFSGIITAVESERNSFTVESSDGIVKMFQVSPSRKSSLSTGGKVTVSYQDDYRWPLKTTSISGGSYTK